MTRKRITLFEYCSNKGLDKLMSEWNERNKNIDPKKITYGSSKMAWWKCEHGHEWQASIYDRTHFEKSTCPYCSNRRVLKGYNDLKSKFPRIARQWDYSKNEGVSPQDVFYNSSKEAWWKCKEGHSWKATVKSRTHTNNEECPYCANKKTLKGYNDLETTNPELLKEWDYDKNNYLNPEELIYDSNLSVWWKCENGHSWRQKISDRTLKNKTKCPKCLKNAPSEKDINLPLNITHPELAKEWNTHKNKGVDISSVTASSVEKVWWKCKKGHEWESLIYTRTHNDKGCPFCKVEKE